MNLLWTCLLCLAGAGLCSCDPPPTPSSHSRELIEEREDGLAYVRDSSEKYSGVFRSYNSRGWLESEQHYAEGIKHGPFFSYGPTGTIQRRIDYFWGEATRDRSYYPEGAVRFDKELRDGTPHGLTRIYFPTGQLKEILIHKQQVDSDYCRYGQRVEYDEEGNLKEDRIYREPKTPLKSTP
jgi:antitoxin component YwqK of YwqJK toxin-antitoxin module